MRILTGIVSGCFLLLAFNPTSTSAQAWRDAVLVMNSGDSVRGQIDFADPDISVSMIQFRTDAGSSAVTYNTEQVTSFVLTREQQRFERLEAQVTYYSIGVVPWGGNPVVGVRPLKAFAEVISSSPSITLFSIYDTDRKERFFVTKGGELTELRNVSYMVERNSTTFKVHEPSYQGQLRSLLADCLGPQTRTLSYDRRSLGKAVDAYIKCKGESASSAPMQTHRLLNIGGFVLVGTGRSEGESLGWGGTLGVSAQILSRKNRGNQFLWLEAGPGYLGAYGGSYFGQGRVQPLIDVGVTTLRGSFTGGLGVAYNKRVVFAGNIHIALLDEGVGFTMKVSFFPRVRRK